MPPYRRSAVYDLGPEPLAQAGAEWLGWDARSGQAVPAGGGEWTRTPRRYGFHATIKAPFRLAEGALAETLSDCFAALRARLAPLALPRLRKLEYDLTYREYDGGHGAPTPVVREAFE